MQAVLSGIRGLAIGDAGSNPAPAANFNTNTMETKKSTKPAERPEKTPKAITKAPNIEAINEVPAPDAQPDLETETITTVTIAAPGSAEERDEPKDEGLEVFDKYLVVIPYYAAGAQGRELAYCIEGWRRHFNEPYHIVIVGDLPEFVDLYYGDITYIHCPRVEVVDSQYTCHRDFVNKLRKVRAAFPEIEGFIFCSDDVYAVNDFDIADVRFLKQNGDEIKFDKNAAGACWETEKRKTKEILEADGYPTRNFTTHLPQWLEWDKLEALWDKYDMANESYIFEDLYFNIYFADRVPFQLNIEHDNLKCGIYRANPRWELVRRAFKKQIWIQNGVDGWTAQLDQMLNDYYFA